MADILIKNLGSGSWSQTHNAGPWMVSGQVGYAIFRVTDGPSNTDMAWSKTIDGGATWSTRVIVTGTGHSNIIQFVCWPDWFTPGLTTGTLIHVCFMAEVTDEIVYFALDTANDTIARGPTQVHAYTKNSAIPSLAWTNHMLGFTQSRAKGGQTMLYMSFHHKPGDDATLVRSSRQSTDDGATWPVAANLSESPMGGVGISDRYIILPGNEADEYDLVAIYYDRSANQMSWYTWDDSLTTWTEQTVFDTIANPLQRSFCIGAMVRHSDGHILAAYLEPVVANTPYTIHTVEWQNITLGNITRADVFTSEAGFHDGCGLHIDQTLDNVYVNWHGAPGESVTLLNYYFTASVDGMVSWISAFARVNTDPRTEAQEGWGFQSTGPGGVRRFFSWSRALIPVYVNKGTSGVLADPNTLSITPQVGPTTGGQQVTFLGSAFDDLIEVRFGGTPSPTIISQGSTQLVVLTPAHAPGNVTVEVETAYSTETILNGYRYITVPATSVPGAGAGSGREFTAYISPDGRVHEFHTPHPIGRFIISQSGWGTPPIEYIVQRGPFQHGETVKDFFLRPRVIQMLVRENLCNRDEWWASRADLLNDIRPNRQTVATATAPGQLRRVKSSGEVRDLDVFIAEGPRFEPQVAGTWDEWSWQEVLRFIAHNPIEFDPTEVIGNFTITLPGSLIFPITFTPLVSITFGGAITETLLLDYIGTWESLPRILITGPIDNPRIDNTTTSEKLEFAFDVPAGREVEIDLAYGVKTVLEGPTGGPYTINRIGTLSSDSDLATFHLAPTPEAPQVAGADVPTARNTITLTGRGVGAGTAVQVRYFTRFFGI